MIKPDNARYEAEGEQILTRGLRQSILNRMQFVKRKAIKAAKKLPIDFEQQRNSFYSRIQSSVLEHNVPDDLIINFNETSIFIVPSSQYSMAPIGSKQVTVIGKEDKRQITALLTVTAPGKLLPPQLIYQGKTNQCNPNYQFPDDYFVDHTPSHWSDRDSIILYAKKILVPYFINKRRELNLSEDHIAIVIFDVHASQMVKRASFTQI
jgi:hypothetical protein